MKNLKFYLIVFSFLFAVSTFAQLQLDKQLQLTGTGTDAKVSGIKDVSANQDAVNVDILQKGNLIYATASGSSNNFTINVSPSIGALQAGMVFNFLSNQTINGPATLTVNNLASKPIKKNVTQDLGCEIQTGQFVTVAYDGTNFQLTSFPYLATLPGAGAKAATGIAQTQFNANWSASAGATTYYLDIASDSLFTSIISGYNNLNTGNVLTLAITGLSCDSTYYYRIRGATNCGSGTNSNVISVKMGACFICGVSLLNDTRDGQNYTTLSMSGSSSPYCTGSSHCWMEQNLNIGTFVTGVTNQTSGSDNQNTSIEKYCYNDDVSNCATYGGIYQWHEMMAYGTSVSGNGPGPQGICPTGWHLPTDNEWKCLEMNIEGMSQGTADGTGFRGSDEGNRLKESGTAHWSDSNGGTNTTGFTALGAGYRSSSGTFNDLTYGERWWMATESSSGSAWLRFLYFNNSQIDRDNLDENYAISVRCVMN